MAKKVENTIAAMSGFPGDGGLGNPQDAGQTPEPEKPDTGEVEDSSVDFPLPKGFEPPAGVKKGEEFTALASLRLDADGDLQLTKLDGIPVQGESNEQEEDETNEQEGEQNPPGATGAEGAVPTGGKSAIASARNIMGEMGMPA